MTVTRETSSVRGLPNPLDQEYNCVAIPYFIGKHQRKVITFQSKNQVEQNLPFTYAVYDKAVVR